ncbi:hypothetical protein GIB67_020818 [Kingdonia uniflora]|uniref:Uncharacterized protein n=1 Tax=Kingdonia uniflora TaxID=39325 RepID=A0A7J7M780_9MAGN|nr:hypothetical protein GIB67_020818 [Kingdonia uniflora]
MIQCSLGVKAASARNSANRENLTAPTCVGRDSMVVVRHRLSVDKDRKGHLIGLGASIFPTLLKKAKHLLIQILSWLAPNLHLNKKCILNGFSEAKVARGEVVFVDPATPTHQGILGEGFYKILLYEIYSPNCPLVKPDGYVNTLGKVQAGGCLQQSKSPENLLRLVAGCRLQVADCWCWSFMFQEYNRYFHFELDWVHVSHQPTFDHPFLKNHSIQI